MVNIVFLDAQTMGPSIDFTPLTQLGNFTKYEQTSREEVYERLKDADIAIVNKTKMSREVMDACPRVRLICVAATGMNNVDLEYAEEKGIVVKNVAGYSTDSVVQLTYGLLLSLLMHLANYDEYVKDGSYSESSNFTHYLSSFSEIAGKQIGIIGMGAIGHKSAKVAEAFGARVVYYSTSGKNNDSTYQRLSLEKLLETSDIVCIHAPLNDATYNLLHAGNLCLMKSSAILINTGRGGIVNEEDLAQALDKGLIAGAGIDVFSREPLPADSLLLKTKHPERLILTPHIAWCSIEARTRLLNGIVENIKAYLNT